MSGAVDFRGVNGLPAIAKHRHVNVWFPTIVPIRMRDCSKAALAGLPPPTSPERGGLLVDAPAAVSSTPSPTRWLIRASSLAGIGAPRCTPHAKPQKLASVEATGSGEGADEDTCVRAGWLVTRPLDGVPFAANTSFWLPGLRSQVERCICYDTNLRKEILRELDAWARWPVVIAQRLALPQLGQPQWHTLGCGSCLPLTARDGAKVPDTNSSSSTGPLLSCRLSAAARF